MMYVKIISDAFKEPGALEVNRKCSGAQGRNENTNGRFPSSDV